MIILNLRERNEQGILKIGVVDLYSNGKEDAILPYPMQPHYSNDAWTNHADNVIKLIRRFVPNAIIYLVRHDKRGIQYLIDQSVVLVNVSLAGYSPSTIYQELANKAFIVASAGNSGTKGESWLSLQDYSCAVGSVDANLNPMYYSGYGKGAVKTVAMEPILNGKTLHGTSFASPVITGLLAQWKTWYFRTLKCYPSISETNEFIKTNSHDVFEEGNDLRTGYGLLRLPEKFEAEEVIVMVGNQLAVKLYHTEGEMPFQETVDLLEVPFIKNDRTFVPSNGLTSAFGINVHWNQERGTSHYIR
jgi:hypothetical protein